MNYNNYVNKLLEDFNIFPRAQSAPSTGPDQGMTTGDMANTFPSKLSTIILKKKKKKIKKGFRQQ